MTTLARRAAYWLVRLARPPVFVVTFRAGRATAANGAPPAEWLADCGAIAAEFGVERGHVDAVRAPHGLALRFSPDVPAASHQRFRNVFALCVQRGRCRPR